MTFYHPSPRLSIPIVSRTWADRKRAHISPGGIHILFWGTRVPFLPRHHSDAQVPTRRYSFPALQTYHHKRRRDMLITRSNLWSISSPRQQRLVAMLEHTLQAAPSPG